ncbi:MAG: DUF4922 domain-containing protein [Thermodesulfobacteriota bacterium]
MDYKYIEDLHRKFRVSDEMKSLFEKVVETPTERGEDILRDAHMLIERADLAYALLALYRQQVNSGFVLADPLKPEGKEEKIFFDNETGITFRLQWNPDRELRNDHELLIERGVIAEHVDETILINKDESGKACYLCKANVHVQNPGEILLEIDLAGDRYYAGANFAYITNNHFTIMSAVHRPQQYRKNILKSLNDFIDKTGGYFRAIFNGLAGASIEGHEHLQVTTAEFPIEEIRIESRDVMYKSGDIRVSQPKYYIPVWVVEGTDKTKVEDATDKIIRKWHSLDDQYRTENIISSRLGNRYRTFIVLRDKRKLAGKGKRGSMGAFETGGNIVLSYEPRVDDSREINEKHTFDKADLETIKELLRAISPEKQSYSRLAKVITFTDIGT